MRVLVSGIGRSATTMLYQQVGQMMVQAFKAPRFRYEPYLWNMNSPFVKGSRFGPEDLSTFGIYAHKASPLFLSDSHPVHDAYMQSIFGNDGPVEGDPQSPDSWLVKVIRGSGRLEAYLRTFPDLKLIICLRNPVDTLNSSMGMFSFTGEEFHASDAPRLLEETKEHLPHIELPSPERPSHLAVSAIWWRAFTEWSLKVAAKYPDRCYIFRHETFSTQQDAEIKRLVDFLGFSSVDAFKVKLEEPAGPKISSTHLLASDLAEIHPHLAYYLDECMGDVVSPRKRKEMELDILRRYAEQPFSPQIAADRLGRKSTVQLRGDILAARGVALKYSPPRTNDPVRLPLREHVQAYASSHGIKVGMHKVYAPPSAARRKGMTFGCCITSFNNKDTIRDAIFSALDQTMPFDRIVVIDDASTDGSPALLRDLEGRYSSLTVHYKEHNGGISAARQIAYSMLHTDYITQLDGDDCFWPTKNREEAEVIFDDPTAVAFSPVLRDDGGERTAVIDPSEYAGDPLEVFEKLLGRDDGIPRDMTVPAETFRKAGGYDLRLSLYEDWDMKLRLARASGPWRVSGSHVGTVYNRRRPGLSNSDSGEHSRALTYVFLKNVLDAPHTPGLTRRYEQAVRSHQRQVTNMVQSLLARVDAGEFPVTSLKSLISRRWMSAMLSDYRGEVETLIADPTGLAPVTWTTGPGFGENEAPFAAIERPNIHWQQNGHGMLNLTVRRAVAGIAVEVCNPAADNNVTLEIRGSGGSVFQASYDVRPCDRVGKILQPVKLPAAVRLEPGHYEIHMKTSTFRDEVSKVRKVPRKLYIIVTDIVGAD